MFRITANGFGDTRQKLLRFFRAVAVILRFIRDERIVLPDRHAVLAPIRGERVSRQRFAGIPFALAVMQQRARREFSAQPLDEFAGQNSFLVRDGGEIPFRSVGIVHGNKRRFAAHRQAHVAFFQIGINRVAERLDFFPLRVGVRQRDARRFINARDVHLERKFRFTFVQRAGNRRGAGRIGRAGERNVAFAREQTGSRVKSNPAAAGQINFRTTRANR